MRIAYLYSRYPVVSQTFCDSEMLALEALGFDLEIVSLNAPPDSFRHERLDRLKAEIHYPPPEQVLDAEGRTPEFKEKLGHLIAAHDQHYGRSYKAAIRARNAWHFAPLLRKLGVQHVHVHFANRATHTALFLKKLGFSFSFTAHAQDFMVDLGSEPLLQEMAREAEFVVCVSDHSRELLAKICPDSAEKIIRIYNGIELDDFPAAKPEQQPGPLRLVSVGRLIEFKGFSHLINAVGLLKNRGVAVQATIIGEGPLRGELEQQLAHDNLTDVISLAGVRSQEQIKRELSAANAFVLPSIVDGKGACDILPTVITEAMACRLPVISTKVTGIPEMVAGGETGLLVDPGDDAALADAIALLGSEPQKRAAFGVAGRKRSEQLFSLSITARQLADRFEKVPAAATKLPRLQAPIVYLMNQWDEAALRELPQDDNLRVLCAAPVPRLHPDTPPPPGNFETLPDASVLESLWLRRPDQRRLLERCRDELGAAISGEEFYLQARRVLWLADVLPRRGVKHVHAFRSDAVAAVWLLGKLSSLKTSAAIEESPTLSRAVLARLLPDFGLVSNSDEKLAGEARFSDTDALHLKKIVTHRQMSFGPLRVKRRADPVPQDRSRLERAWLGRLLQSLHA